MLRAEHKLTNMAYYSWDTNDYNIIIKDKSLFICPECKSTLIFVDGLEVIKHFRHKVKSDCDFEPESEDHLEMKMFVKEFLDLRKDEVEVHLGFAKPDLLIKSDMIAIEVQKSNISKKRFLERCFNYTQNGIAVMWIFHESLLMEKGKDKNIPLLLRTASENAFGRIYIYSNKIIYSIKLNTLSRWVNEYEDYDTGESYGGYLKTYKRKRNIEIIQTIPDKKYGKTLYKVRSKFAGQFPSGYLIAKFYDI